MGSGNGEDKNFCIVTGLFFVACFHYMFMSIRICIDIIDIIFVVIDTVHYHNCHQYYHYSRYILFGESSFLMCFCVK